MPRLSCLVWSCVDAALLTLKSCSFPSVTQSCLTLWPHGLQHARPPCPSTSPGACSDSRLLSRWCHPTTSSSVVHPPPAFSLSQHQGLFQWVSSLHQEARVWELQHQYQSFWWILRTDFPEDGLVGSPCSLRDLQESSSTPQFKSINSSPLEPKMHLNSALLSLVGGQRGCSSQTLHLRPRMGREWAALRKSCPWTPGHLTVKTRVTWMPLGAEWSGLHWERWGEDGCWVGMRMVSPRDRKCGWRGPAWAVLGRRGLGAGLCSVGLT